MVFTTSLLGAQHIGIEWNTSRQACLLCPWARHLTGCSHLHVVDRWWGQAVYPSWWPSLTKDMQTEHELIRMKKSQTSEKQMRRRLNISRIFQKIKYPLQRYNIAWTTTDDLKKSSKEREREDCFKDGECPKSSDVAAGLSTNHCGRNGINPANSA